jgi:hypothetical protein
MADTTIAKIQLRRGALDDLPALDEGELGYALDARRLFIGNAVQAFTGDGVTTEYTISDSNIIPTQIGIKIDGVDYSFSSLVTLGSTDLIFGVDETTIVFPIAPVDGAIVEVFLNTELQTIRRSGPANVIAIEVPDIALDISGDPLFYNTGISWPAVGPNSSNSAIFKYSYRNTAGDMAIGEIKIIQSGTEVATIDSGTTLGTPGLSLDAVIHSDTNRIHIQYANTSEYSGNLHYSLELWNTI